MLILFGILLQKPGWLRLLQVLIPEANALWFLCSQPGGLALLTHLAQYCPQHWSNLEALNVSASADPTGQATLVNQPKLALALLVVHVNNMRFRLQNYVKADWKVRFFHFCLHPNRHWIFQVREVINRIDSGELQTPQQIYDALDELTIGREPRGYLANIMRASVQEGWCSANAPSSGLRRL